MKIGVSFPTTEIGNDPFVMRDFAQAAEDMGYEYLTAIDHVLQARDPAGDDFRAYYTIDNAFHEPLILFSYLAAVTKKIGFVTAILILPQRPTVLVAKQAAQVDVLSNGRLRLGVGVGWNPVEYRALGQDWTKRGKRQSEQIELLKKLWTERSVNFQGEFDQVMHAGVNPLPIQRPIPIWFGGGSDATLKRAARMGDGWIPLGNPGSKTTKMIEKLNAFLQAENRKRESFGIEAWIRYGDGDPDVWKATAEKWMQLGATHLTFYTSGQGAGTVSQQIEAMKIFKEALK